MSNYLRITRPYVTPGLAPLPTQPSPDRALRIVDNFLPVSPHGMQVAEAARGTGYRGEIFGEADAFPRGESALLCAQTQITMGTEVLEPAQTLKGLEFISLVPAMQFLINTSRPLQRDAQSQVHGSVTNFSQGISAASTVWQIYEGSLLSPQLGQNLARAWDVDPSNRALLQQRLIDDVQSLLEHPVIGEAQKRWATAVEEYEGLGNSVVVSAGNHGDVLARLERFNGGHPLQARPGFDRNLLSHGAVTAVGAGYVRDNGAAEIADYSSRTGADVYAYDALPDGKTGTSFSAPRVAALMTQLHRTRPDWSSPQVEQEMRQIIGPVEEPGKIRRFMESQLW